MSVPPSIPAREEIQPQRGSQEVSLNTKPQQKLSPGKIIVHQGAQSPWYEIVTGDQVSLSLSDSGIVTGIAIGEDSLIQGEREPFLINDFTGGLMTSLGGTVIPLNATTLRQQGRSGNVLFTCDYEAHSEYIALDFTLQALQPVNCSLDVGFSLPINATGWKWWDSLQSARVIHSSRPIYENVYYPPTHPGYPEHDYRLGHGKINNLPFALISNESCGLAFAIDLGLPVTYFMGYNASFASFYSVFSLGLSNLPEKLQGRARARLILYRSDPVWGLRSTADRYYNIFPEYFDSSRSVAGAHAFQGDAATVIPRDVGVTYVQGDYNRFNDTTPYGGLWGVGAWYNGLVDECEGIKSLQYIGGGTAMGFSCKQEQYGNDSEIRGVLNAYQNSTDAIERDYCQATLNTYSLPSQALSSLLPMEFSWFPRNWGPGFFVSVNMDPEIADYTPVDFFFQYYIDPAFQDNARIGISVDGLMVDNQGPPADTSLADTNASHFASIDYPLTYLNTTFEPVVSLVESCVEALKVIRARMQEEYGDDKIISGNVGSAFPQGLFQVPYIDVFMMESVLGEWGPVNNEVELERLRVMANQKAICGLDYNSNSREAVQQYINRLLPYAIFPQSGGNWTRDIDLYQKYVPIFQHLQNSGWKPVTEASATSVTIPANELTLERFGANEQNDLYFVLRDVQDEYAGGSAPSSQVQISIPAGRFNLGAECIVEEEVTQRVIPCEIVQTPSGAAIVFNVTIGDGDSLVFKVFKPDLAVSSLCMDTVAPQNSHALLLRAQGTYTYPADGEYLPSLHSIRVRFYDGHAPIGESVINVLNSTHWQSEIFYNPGVHISLRNLSAYVDPYSQIPEYLENNNIACLMAQLPLVWHYQVNFSVNTLGFNRQNGIGSLHVNFSEIFNTLGIPGMLDPDSLRVFSYNHSQTIKCQFLLDFQYPAALPNSSAGDVIFPLGDVAMYTTLHYGLYFDILENGKKPAPLIRSSVVEVSERHARLDSNRLVIFSPLTGGLLKIRDGLLDVCSEVSFCSTPRGGHNESRDAEQYYWGELLDAGPLAARIILQHRAHGPYAGYGTLHTVYFNGVVGEEAFFIYAESTSQDKIRNHALAAPILQGGQGGDTLANVGFGWNETSLQFCCGENSSLDVSQCARERWYGVKTGSLDALSERTPFIAMVADDLRWDFATIMPSSLQANTDFAILSNISPGQVETYKMFLITGCATMDAITTEAQSLLPLDVQIAP